MKGIKRTIKRRRQEAKTDYHARLRLLVSGKPRLVIRKTNRYIIGQIVTSTLAQDKVIVGASSKELLSFGWPESLKGSLKNLTAAYLTGKLLGEKSTSVREAILDIGMYRNAEKGRLYAFLRGAIDGGIVIPHNPEILPSDARFEENKKTREVFLKLKGGLKTDGRKRNKE